MNLERIVSPALWQKRQDGIDRILHKIGCPRALLFRASHFRLLLTVKSWPEYARRITNAAVRNERSSHVLVKVQVSVEASPLHRLSSPALRPDEIGYKHDSGLLNSTGNAIDSNF